jgi:hypothetical protein
MTRRSQLLLWLLLLAAAATVLRLVISSRSNLWPDEVFSVAVATGHSLEHPAAVADPSLGDYVEAPGPLQAEELRQYVEHDAPPASLDRLLRAVLLSDTSPPLYYLQLSLWTRLFGTGDVAVRLYSIVWSLACLPLLAGLARRLGGGRAVLAATALFAFSPMVVYYSVEARMYSLLWFLVLALMLLSLHAQQRGPGALRYCLWVLVGAAGFLTHYFFVFPFAAAAAYLMLQPGRTARWHAVAGSLLICLLLLPWYLKLPQSMAAWRITAGWLEWEPNHFDWWQSFRELVLHFFSGQSFGLWRLHHRWNAVALVLFALIGVIALLRLRLRWFQGRRLLLWLWFAAACLGPVAFDLVQGTYTVAVPRYATTALPAACLLAAVGLGTLSWRARTAVLALIIIAWVPSLGAIYRKAGRSGAPLREIARAVSAETKSADVVLIQSIPSGVLGYARYATGPAPIASWVEQLGQRTGPASLHPLIAGRERVYFLRYHELGSPTLAEDWLREHAIVVREQPFNGTLLTVFAPRDANHF